MRKVAIATEDGNTAQHFGHCEGFTLFDLDEEKVIGKSFVENPGHKPGFLPNYLNDLGVTTVIAGGMGGGAINIFEEKNIEVITGAEGSVDSVIQKYTEGKLESAQSVCA